MDPASAVVTPALKSYILQSPVMKSFLAGSLSGTCSAVVFQPLDLLKTRIQAPVLVHGERLGLVSVVRQIVQTERVTSLWRGVSPTMLRCVPGVGLYFSTLHQVRAWWDSPQPSPLENVCMGAASRCIATTLVIPFTVVKTRFESVQYHYSSIPEAFRKIYTAEGARGLSTGLAATLLRDAPFSGAYLMFYSLAKENIPDGVRATLPVSTCHFLCGVMAGCLASGVTQPADVVKTKLQLYPHQFHSTLDAVRYVYQVYGYKGYFKGLVPRCLRRTLMAAMAWTVYEELTVALGLK